MQIIKFYLKNRKASEHARAQRLVYTYPDNLGSQVMKSYVIPVQ